LGTWLRTCCVWDAKVCDVEAYSFEAYGSAWCLSDPNDRVGFMCLDVFGDRLKETILLDGEDERVQ
tara:strand:- start:263 stop:460 length:198 start_codon:yes stop_codon:yes gene_type:complete